MQGERGWLLLLLLPAALIFLVFFTLPMGRLFLMSGAGELGWSVYLTALTEQRYWRSMLSTITLSVVVTLSTLVIAGIAGVFLARNQFTGIQILTALLTLPLAFPGVVIGFMVIMLGGRQGLVSQLSEPLLGEPVVFAYSMVGLFVGYIYFSIPRTILTVMAAAEKLDQRLIEAARSLGASNWRVLCDVYIPGLRPALLAAGAICFATSMGAFGTAFTLATKIDVMPMVIYTEFTLHANIAMAAVLSFLLGLVTWAALAFARTLSGSVVSTAA
ncbi:ABC transporter permease [Hydrogenophaga sp.]|uniref:ABC transporter permease n=1 Tax=Hydrogenophaga sp. TaxID=1904254 RepID=UPI0019A2C7A3|nr:ABC transporter permease [Hydrogenophaga sp.]MBD3893851.1 ABC transporter permease subunit [Hydrogenophaga sp.]